MDENTFKKQIEGQLRNKIKGYLQGGCFWSIDHNLTTGIVIDNIEQVIEELVQIASQHTQLTSHKYDNNKSKADNIKEINEIIEQNIEQNIGVLTCAISTGKTEKVMFMNQSVKLDVVMCTKLQNGKITQKIFGIKKNGQQYTPEEIKVILKKAEEVECDEKFKDGRVRKYSLLSMIVDIDDKSIKENNKNPIRFIMPDNNKDEVVYKEICNIVKQAKQDYPNDAPPNILLIPYSADGHIVTLLVDKSKVDVDETTGEVSFNKDSIMCFDSSHYFTGYIGNGFSKRFFPKEIYKALENKKLPINKKAPQQKEGTCSFYTEAFCYVISDYIRLNPNATLDEVQKYVNTPDVERLIEYYKNLFFNEYKATMEEVERKQDRQKENIKQEITNNITVQQNRQLTPDERHYQQLLNQYGVYRYGQGFMDIINDINGINNSNPFNPDQQNALVSHFIDSTTLTHLNNDNNVIVGFHNNIRDIVYRANDGTSALNNGTAPVNFIYTLGTERNQNPDAGTHYVAAQIFRDKSTNRLVVLHYDSLRGTVSDEFERYIRKEFGENIQIINISNQNRFTQQEQGAYTCGLCALTALRDNGILDQERARTIKKYHMSQDTNFNMYNTPQQTPIQPQLSENFRGLIDIKTDNTPQRQQNQPSFQTQRTLPPPPPTPRSSSPSISGGND